MSRSHGLPDTLFTILVLVLFFRSIVIKAEYSRLDSYVFCITSFRFFSSSFDIMRPFSFKRVIVCRILFSFEYSGLIVLRNIKLYPPYSCGVVMDISGWEVPILLELVVSCIVLRLYAPVCISVLVLSVSARF